MFLNIEIALSCYFSLIIANGRAEPLFSKPQRIGKESKSKDGRERLNNTNLITIKHEFSNQIDMDHVADQFAQEKCRKGTLLEVKRFFIT